MATTAPVNLNPEILTLARGNVSNNADNRHAIVGADYPGLPLHPQVAAGAAVAARRRKAAGVVWQQDPKAAEAAGIVAPPTDAEWAAVRAEVKVLVAEYQRLVIPHIDVDQHRAAYGAAIRSGSFSAVMNAWLAWTGACVYRHNIEARRAELGLMLGLRLDGPTSRPIKPGEPIHHLVSGLPNWDTEWRAALYLAPAPPSTLSGKPIK